jgi:uncharacterized protein (TIGR00375 family)
MEINIDLHIHSKYSGGTSEDMNLANLARGASQKGIHLIGSGDGLHPAWLREIKGLRSVDEGTFEIERLRVILTCEIEDSYRVHHLLIFPAVSKLEDFSEKIAGRVSDLSTDGRPRFHGNGLDLAQIAQDCGVLIGPCHAFTPWTSVYAAFDTLRACYRDLVKYVQYLELGLSADTSYADRISELHNLTFLTNSDAHSPWPLRLAREFMRVQVEEITCAEVIKALRREGQRRVVVNVGVPPEEGKYNESACIKCFRHYTLSEAKKRGWRCTCGGRIKKGVKDRVEELADLDKPASPAHRPPYIHVIPLTEIIARAEHSTPNTKKVLGIWNELITTFGNEVNILIDTPLEALEKHAPQHVLRAIAAFRAGKIVVKPGGGGQYGEIIIPEDLENVEMECSAGNAGVVEKEKTDDSKKPKTQATLDQYF